MLLSLEKVCENAIVEGLANKDAHSFLRKGPALKSTQWATEMHLTCQWANKQCTILHLRGRPEKRESRAFQATWLWECSPSSSALRPLSNQNRLGCHSSLKRFRGICFWRLYLPLSLTRCLALAATPIAGLACHDCSSLALIQPVTNLFI